MKNDKKLKMAIIAGASKALEHKESNSRLSDSEIIRMISKDAKKIIENLDDFDE